MLKIKEKLFPKYVSRSTITLFLINGFFKNILRVNAKAKVNLHFASRFVGAGGLIIVGDNPNLQLCLMSNPSIYINTADKGISIDSSVYIASGVKLIGANHDVNDLTIAAAPSDIIRIGRDCWLGANSVILPAVQLGPKTIVGAGSIVTKSFSGNCIIAGNPAKIIRSL
jgi:acetyltransferase-like isoleucine patch superfamily enzyme